MHSLNFILTTVVATLVASTTAFRVPEGTPDGFYRAYVDNGVEIHEPVSPVDMEVVNTGNKTVDMIQARYDDLQVTDPRDDKARIEQTKGGLLADAYKWVLDNGEFRQWRDDANSRLLWIRGDPGKGKTMLLCGIIEELSKSVRNTGLLSYFFCQATDIRINSATAVLRSLLYLLVKQQPSLVMHVLDRYKDVRKQLFEGTNAWAALLQMFTCVFEDANLQPTFLVIDALDECVADLPLLLEFIVDNSPVFSRVK